MHGLDIDLRHFSDGLTADTGAVVTARAGRSRRSALAAAAARAGAVDYEETGAGPTIVFVPGSCSTSAAWRPVVSQLEHRFRCVSTSLLGYGGTEERRTASDPSIDHECDAVESVIEAAGGRVHLVGHSFGGLVALAVALRGKVQLASLTVIEAPAANILRELDEQEHYAAFRGLTRGYFSDYADGNAEAISAVIDFYGGAGTFASWPERLRAHAVETTSVNILDWASAYDFPLSPGALSSIDLPTSVVIGAMSHPGVQRANELISACIEGASLFTVGDASHFLIATHARQLAHVVAAQVAEGETQFLAQ
jgi:pimeloyl-ACP methyl ester carboxylesterase